MTTDTYRLPAMKEKATFTPTWMERFITAGEVEYRCTTLVHPDHRQFRQYYSEHPAVGSTNGTGINLIAGVFSETTMIWREQNGVIEVSS